MKPTKYLMFGANGLAPWWYTDATNNLPPAACTEWSGMDEEEARAFARKGKYMYDAVAAADRYWVEIHNTAHPEEDNND